MDINIDIAQKIEDYNDSKRDIIDKLFDEQIQGSGYKIDYITLTIETTQQKTTEKGELLPITTMERLLPVYQFFKEFDINVSDFEDANGLNHYTNGLSYGGGFIRVNYNEWDNIRAKENNNHTANIIITGQGCTFLHSRAKGSNPEYYILSKVHEYAKNITRLDIALDVFEDGILDLNVVADKLDNNEYVSPKRSKNVIKEDDGHGEILGHVRYLGAKSSGNFGRFYDKMAQYKKEGNQLPKACTNGIWYRYELQFGSTAVDVINAFLFDPVYFCNMDKLYKSIIAKWVTFKDRTHTPTGRLMRNKRNWRTSEFWTHFLEKTPKFEFNSATRDPAFIDMMSWISASVMPTINILDEILRHHNLDIYDLLKQHQPTANRSKKQELAILNAIDLEKYEVDEIVDSFVTGKLRRAYLKRENKRIMKEREMQQNGQDLQTQ